MLRTKKDEKYWKKSNTLIYLKRYRIVSRDSMTEDNWTAQMNIQCSSKNEK